MDLTLRPMSTSQVLDRTFHIYRNYVVLLAGIGALLPAMLLVLQLLFIPLGFPPRADVKQRPEMLALVLLGYLLCYGIIYVLSGAFTSGATVFAVSKLHLGQSMTIGEAYKKVFSRFWRVLGVTILVSIIVFGSIIVGEIIAIIVFGVGAGSVRIFGGGGAPFGPRFIFAIIWAVITFVAGLCVGIFFYCKLALAVPACLLEDLPVGAALQRSWNLTKHSFWRILLVFLLTWVLSVVLGVVLGIPGQAYTTVLHNKAIVVGVILQYLGGFIAGVLANPISTTAIALIYYDKRIRKEAFDLQLMMEAVGQQSQQQMAVAAPPTTG
ncbi:MAG TPA: glycerophosphoryl diester phosphodiesterase membrane domain-containing protein [Candidatus Sulfotelmatobacter sp.]|nr:glycerophosphoryl diester phosphodiesterase membrane domain-containing protein [Candidatus Sulfotelmatobacter sp.]